MKPTFETNFTVMPIHANYLSPLIFGGAFFSEMDICAAQTVNRALHNSKTANGAVTYKADVTWTKPCYVGDLVYLKGEVLNYGEKSIVVRVTAEREKRGNPARDKVGDCTFVFVSINKVDLPDKPDLLDYVRHGLKNEEGQVR